MRLPFICSHLLVRIVAAVDGFIRALTYEHKYAACEKQDSSTWISPWLVYCTYRTWLRVVHCTRHTNTHTQVIRCCKYIVVDMESARVKSKRNTRAPKRTRAKDRCLKLRACNCSILLQILHPTQRRKGTSFKYRKQSKEISSASSSKCAL